jgi:hypothetical protein
VCLNSYITDHGSSGILSSNVRFRTVLILDSLLPTARHNSATPCDCVNALLVGVMPRALGGCAMSSYRYCFLNCDDRVAEFHVIACEDDGQAQIRADRLLAACDYPMIEVWDHGRRVYCARKTPPPPLR